MAGVTAAAITGAAVIGGAYLSSKAAKSAANTQAGAANQATAEQRAIFERQTELQEPFRQAGMQGQNRLLELLGIQPTAFGPGNPWNEAAYLKANPDVAAAVGRGEFANAKQHYDMFGQSEGRPLGFTPARGADFGKYATAEFGGVKGFDPASLMKNFSEADFKADPGYAFRLSEGMKALDRTAASRGGLLSGATLKGAQRFGSDLASQEYANAFNRFQANRASQSGEFQNAFNRFQAERTGTLNPFQSLAGVGQSSANTLTNASGQFGQQIGSNIIGAGNAMAAGQVGSANAIAGGVGQGINFYQNQQMMNRLFPTTAATQYGPPVSAMMPLEG